MTHDDKYVEWTCPVFQVIHPVMIYRGRTELLVLRQRAQQLCLPDSVPTLPRHLQAHSREDPLKSSFIYHGALWHRQMSRRIKSSANLVAFTFTLWAEVSNLKEIGGNCSVIYLFTFFNIWKRSCSRTRQNFDGSCSCSHCFFLDFQVDITNVDTTSITCFCFCSWQDSALTHVSMPDDRHWWLLRAVDSRSRQVYVPFQGHNFGHHSAIHPYKIKLIPVCTSLYNGHFLGQCQELNWEKTSWVKGGHGFHYMKRPWC